MAADMILPKGIVFNKNSIYEEIAKYDIVPLEKIHAACHVFSTTSRKLVDPTARRLENFWTRVLGGDRRYLPGTVIARIFQSISEEESFVKLRGPANRYEPPSPTSKAELPARIQAAKTETSGGEPSGSKSKGKPKATKATKAIPTSTKQPHPILKKPRGPSHSGPRPKTRFVSPAGSDDERKDAELGSSGSTAVNHSGDSKVSSNSTAKEDRKKATNTTPKKKTTFVASTASRRRPGMPRRISSQSSAAVGGSDGSKEGISPLRQAGSQGPTLEAQPENPGKGVSPTNNGGERLSAKAAGKRPATRLSPNESTASKSSTAQTSSAHSQFLTIQDEFVDVRPSTRPSDTTINTPAEEDNQTITNQNRSVHRRSDTQERPRSDVPPMMIRSTSDVGSIRRSSQDLTRGGRVPPQALISSSTATISHETAQGTIIEFDENTPAYEAVTSAAQAQDIESSSRRSGSSLLDSRFTPTQPSPTPAVPLGRSKSQLTLLLERQPADKKTRR